MPTPPCLRSSPPPAAGFEWEELPLTGAILRRHVPQASHAIAAEFVRDARSQPRRRLHSEPPVAPVWSETLPALFEPLQPSAPLADTRIDGLAAREIVEPDVFRHFFGALR
jgi:hypothetical protein